MYFYHLKLVEVPNVNKNDLIQEIKKTWGAGVGEGDDKQEGFLKQIAGFNETCLEGAVGNICFRVKEIWVQQNTRPT